MIYSYFISCSLTADSGIIKGFTNDYIETDYKLDNPEQIAGIKFKLQKKYCLSIDIINFILLKVTEIKKHPYSVIFNGIERVLSKEDYETMEEHLHHL